MVTRRDLVTAMLRHNFTLQLSWNYERMQALGFAYSIMPILKKVYPSEDEYFEAIKGTLISTTPIHLLVLQQFLGRLCFGRTETARSGRQHQSSINGTFGWYRRHYCGHSYEAYLRGVCCQHGLKWKLVWSCSHADLRIHLFLRNVPRFLARIQPGHKLSEDCRQQSTHYHYRPCKHVRFGSHGWL